MYIPASYKILSASTLAELETLAVKLVEDGYKPEGGITVTAECVVVRKEDTSKPKRRVKSVDPKDELGIVEKLVPEMKDVMGERAVYVQAFWREAGNSYTETNGPAASKPVAMMSKEALKKAGKGYAD